MDKTYDTQVPAVVFGATSYVLSHGSLGVLRSLGRVGIPVSAILEDAFVPHAYSRFLESRFVRGLTGSEEQQVVLEVLLDVGRAMPRRAVLLPADDEAAVLAAENQSALAGYFLIPAIAPGLPRELASKRRLGELCLRHEVPTPRTIFAKSTRDALAFAETARFPLIVKNSEPWKRIATPAVGGTTRVDSHRDLVSRAASWPREPHIILQEYIPGESAEDWIVHAYRSRNGDNDVAFTGRKHSSWPPGAGVTTLAAAEPNPPLLAVATRFLEAIDYRGIVDMDWRLDLRDGLYKLVDFNPRIGANFRLFMNGAGIDVVRAAHLDLTDRPVPASPQVCNRRLIVENLHLASRLMSGGRSRVKGKTEFAWFALDDPLPFFVMALRFTSAVVLRIWRRPDKSRRHRTTGIRPWGTGRAFPKIGSFLARRRPSAGPAIRFFRIAQSRGASADIKFHEIDGLVLTLHSGGRPTSVPPSPPKQSDVMSDPTKHSSAGSAAEA